MLRFFFCYLPWPFPGFFSFLPSSRADFYPWFSGSHKHRVFMFLWWCHSLHLCTRCTTGTCSACVHMDAWLCVPVPVYSTGCSAPLCSWRWACHCTAGRSLLAPLPEVANWTPSTLSRGSWQGCVRREVCEGHKHCQGSLWIKKACTLLWGVTPSRVSWGVQLATNSRGAKKKWHWCSRSGKFRPDQEKPWIHFTVNQCSLVKMKQTATKKKTTTKQVFLA